MKEDKRFVDLYIQRLMNKTFNSDEERAEFYEKLKKGVEPLSRRDSESLKDQAYNMVFDARDLPDEEGKKIALEALTIDPESIEAYLLLGSNETPKDSIPYFKKGIEIGRKLFDEKYFKENAGFFWNLPETRAFMECLGGYSTVLYEMNRFTEAIPILEEILKLNMNDDMGVRKLLMLALIQMNDFKKFKKYDDIFQDNGSQQLFNRVLYSYKIYGDTENSRKLLHQANKENKYIVPGLIAITKIKRFPDFKKENINFIIAFEYIIIAKKIWIKVDGAINWIRRNIDLK